LIPHIVRGLDVNDTNQQMIDVGTANSLELRHVKATEIVSAPAALPAGAPPAGAAPAGAQPAARPASPVAGGASFLFDPGAITQPKGATFTVNIVISGAQNVYSVPLQLNYDP